MARSRRGIRPKSGAGAAIFALAAAVAAVVAVNSVDLTLRVPSWALASESSAAPSVEPPVAELFHAEWYTQTNDLELSPGEIGDVTVVLRNVGHTSWVRDTPAEVRIGELGSEPLPEDMRVGWLTPNRPAAQSEPVVGEQGLATFTFRVKGGRPGVYRLGLRPVLDGVTWLEDDGIHVDIWVR